MRVSRDGPRLGVCCRCNGCGNSTCCIGSLDSSSTDLWIFIQQHSILSHFDLKRYWASANTQAIIDVIINDQNISVNININNNLMFNTLSFIFIHK
jgi:hypothetical protein